MFVYQSVPRALSIAVSTYVLLFGIPHLLLVELDDDGAELKDLPQQRVLRQLDVYARPERLNEKRKKDDAMREIIIRCSRTGRG